MNKAGRIKEIPFIPRIINPVRIKRAVLFTADAQVREGREILEKRIPWLKTEVLFDPEAVMSVSFPEASVFLFDDTALSILDTGRIRARNPDAVIVLLSFQTYIHCSPPQATFKRYPYAAAADLIFAVGREEFAPSKILVAVVRAAEDLLNIEKYSKARRYIFHLVDDEPRWFSKFLPVLYDIIGQRADVRLTRTYEESLKFLFGVEEESRIRINPDVPQGHGHDVVCLITDIYFPKKGELQSDAGRALIRLVNRHYPHIPVIIASKSEVAKTLDHIGFVLPKGDPGSLEKLRDYILNITGLGDFVICDQEGNEIRRAKDIHGICRILQEAENDSPDGLRLRDLLEDYGHRDKFSTWLYMHSYPELGDRLRPKKSSGQRMLTLLRRHFLIEIARLERIPLLIQQKRIFSLGELYLALQTLDRDVLQPLSDDDVISSWLDRKGYPELAEELRPVHDSGLDLRQAVVQIVEKWLRLYRERGCSV